MKVFRSSIIIVVATILLISESNPVFAKNTFPEGANQPIEETGLSAYHSQAPTPDLLAAYEGTLEKIYAQVNPSVVNINVVFKPTTPDFQLFLNPNNLFDFGNSGISPQIETAIGSGFVWDSTGYIVTDSHVVNNAQKITVTFSDGTTVNARKVGIDPSSDLAVLQVTVNNDELIPVQLADSASVKVGELAVAIGNPFGLSGTMTVGVISGLARTLPLNLSNVDSQQTQIYSIPDIIQTDASINPGNSGGVLVDQQGLVIGVTAAIASTTHSGAGIGFVIPSSIIQKVVPELIKTGHYSHPWLGINGTTLTPDLAEAGGLKAGQSGVLITDISLHGPAEKAGLQGGISKTLINGRLTSVGGDVIVAIDNQPMRRLEDLLSYVFNNTNIGEKVTLSVLHHGKNQDLRITLGTQPEPANP